LLIALRVYKKYFMVDLFFIMFVLIIYFPLFLIRTRAISVDIATRLRAGRRGFDSQVPILWVTGVLSPAVKQPWREADHSPPSSAKVKNAWSYTSRHMSSWLGA